MSQDVQSTAEAIINHARGLRWQVGESFHDRAIEALYEEATEIAGKSVIIAGERPRFNFDRTLDRLLTSRWTGFPIMFLLLAAVFWLTIEVANIPSQMLAGLLLDTVHPALKEFGAWIQMPGWLSGLLFDGMRKRDRGQAWSS